MTPNDDLTPQITISPSTPLPDISQSHTSGTDTFFYDCSGDYIFSNMSLQKHFIFEWMMRFFVMVSDQHRVVNGPRF